MAKKKARQVSKTTTAVTTQTPVAPSVVSRGPVFNPDYSFVARDLKRIGALAGSFVVILVVLSFFLR